MSTSQIHRDLRHPRDILLATMQRIYGYRMTTTSGGNLSVRDRNGDVWITPARVDKGGLTRDDMIRVEPDGTAYGPHPPSSEYPFHRAIYDARPDLHAIVHAHPVALVAFSIAKQAPNTKLFAKSRLICGEPGFAYYALPGSAALGQVIADTFKREHNAVVLENHGVVVGGTNMADAFGRFETFEFTAKTLIKSGQLGTPRFLTDAQIDSRRTPPEAWPTFEPQGVTVEEKDARRKLTDFCQRGYRQRLLISTEGSFSVRIGDAARDTSFVITPSGIDRLSMSIHDPVLIENGKAESGKTPSRASCLHAAIYEKHPDIRAIINAYSVNATAFSVCNVHLDSRTIPESYVFLRDVVQIDHATATHNVDAVAAQVGPTAPAAIIDNDGVLTCGTSLLAAFDCLEVLETTAEAVINTRPLGEVSPMNDQAIADLRKAFFEL
ncbi:MAG: class II aldolase/adducin family protein [Planctomycetota bacterium]